MRDEIRSKITMKIVEETKESLLLECKNKAIEEFQSMFTGLVGAGMNPVRGGEHASAGRSTAGTIMK